MTKATVEEALDWFERVWKAGKRVSTQTVYESGTSIDTPSRKVKRVNRDAQTVRLDESVITLASTEHIERSVQIMSENSLDVTLSSPDGTVISSLVYTVEDES